MSEEEPIEECIAALHETAKRDLTGGILEDMQNLGWRFCGTFDGRFLFCKCGVFLKTFKSWEDVREYIESRRRR